MGQEWTKGSVWISNQNIFHCMPLSPFSVSLSVSVSLLSCFVSRTPGGRWAKKGNTQFGPRLFSLLIGPVFLVEQSGVHLDVTYQRQAQGSGLPFPCWLTVLKKFGFESDGAVIVGGGLSISYLLWRNTGCAQFNWTVYYTCWYRHVDIEMHWDIQ